jgi:PBSX family phage terminase large subunit
MAITYKPHQYQLAFHRSPARFRTLLAGRQSGKTFSGMMEALIQAEKQPGSIGYVVAPTYKHIKDVIVHELKKIINPNVVKKFSEQDMTLEFKPQKGCDYGSIIRFRSADNPESLRGPKAHWIWYDEAREISASAWDIQRPMLATTQGKVWVTTTPNGKDWVYKKFVEPAINGELEFAWWQFTSRDNPEAKFEEIEMAKLTMPDWFYRQEYEASIEEHVGLIYHEFKHSIHVINQDLITPQPTWRFFIGIDVGFHNPTAVLLVAEDQDRKLWVLDEVYEIRLSPEQVVGAIRKMLITNNVSENALMAKIIDPASAQKPQAATDSVQGIMADQPLNFVTESGRNEVIPGIIRVQQYLKVDPKSGEPLMRISNKCKNLITEFEEYVWQPQRQSLEKNASDSPRKFKDHALDALRYIVMNRPELGPLAIQDPWSGAVYYNNEDMEREYIRRVNGESGPYFDMPSNGMVDL